MQGSRLSESPSGSSWMRAGGSLALDKTECSSGAMCSLVLTTSLGPSTGSLGKSRPDCAGSDPLTRVKGAGVAAFVDEGTTWGWFPPYGPREPQGTGEEQPHVTHNAPESATEAQVWETPQHHLAQAPARESCYQSTLAKNHSLFYHQKNLIFLHCTNSFQMLQTIQLIRSS